MIARCMAIVLALGALSLACRDSARAAEQVVVVVGQGAPDLEHIAAQELVAQFKRLFDANVVLTDFLPDRHRHLVLVGGPKKNKAVREVAGETWPALSEQGFILRSFDAADQSGVIVAGDTPVSTLWAVYELGHRLGIRYLLRGDIYPDKQPLNLSGLNVVMEPELKTRTWKTLGGGVTGPESWPVADQRRLIGQLAKMKFNHLILSMRPWQPFVAYNCRGVRKKSAGPWRGERYPIPRDAPGRTAFAAAGSFTNADFAGRQTQDETITAGIEHARGIIAAAKRVGISVGIELAPLEFPREFERVVPGLVPVAGTNGLAVRPGSTLETGDASLRELATIQLRAHAVTYPDVDTLYGVLDGSGDWRQEVASIWQRIVKQVEPSTPRLVLQRLDDGADGNAGVLSQSATRRRGAVLQRRGAQGGDSFIVRHAALPELDPTLHYLSRAAWEDNVTVRSAHDDLFATICGDQVIADRLWLGFGHIESATDLTAEMDRDFSVASPNMLMQHYVGEPAPPWWETLTEHYTQAMIELYRSRGPADPRAQALLYYYAKRSEYVLEYLASVKAIRAAAIAKHDGDIDAAVEHFEVAIESLYNAIDTLGDVARDPGDRGLIAALNAYAYRPLLAEYERLLDSE